VASSSLSKRSKERARWPGARTNPGRVACHRGVRGAERESRSAPALPGRDERRGVGAGHSRSRTWRSPARPDRSRRRSASGRTTPSAASARGAPTCRRSKPIAAELWSIWLNSKRRTMPS